MTSNGFQPVVIQIGGTDSSSVSSFSRNPDSQNEISQTLPPVKMMQEQNFSFNGAESNAGRPSISQTAGSSVIVIGTPPGNVNSGQSFPYSGLSNLSPSTSTGHTVASGLHQRSPATDNYHGMSAVVPTGIRRGEMVNISTDSMNTAQFVPSLRSEHQSQPVAVPMTQSLAPPPTMLFSPEPRHDPPMFPVHQSTRPIAFDSSGVIGSGMSHIDFAPEFSSSSPRTPSVGWDKQSSHQFEAQQTTRQYDGKPRVVILNNESPTRTTQFPFSD